ncbi:hypothetical protein CA54_16770 [Symmachiella macrocystis]|uniref:Uncharacterized protein n=1 Tax=Symmachiella macrocystis TaxID=2527985 RepID=A0A5C6BN48_9PLAN|nr:hypothetical protein [Symmachiella macrocystis]TWU12851.1 hypothetical protein CA54_16770 [Symmachiella macrocystis]
MSCCCDWIWQMVYSGESRDEGITNPTGCLAALATAAGRTDPFPTVLYLEDNYGHVMEFTWDGSKWVYPGGVTTIEGPVRACTANSSEIYISCYSATNINGLQPVDVPAPEYFFIGGVGTTLRVANGYSYDPIDITFDAIVRKIVAAAVACNPSNVAPNGFTPVELRLYE